MAFMIRFSAPPVDSSNPDIVVGEIVLGDHREFFHADLGYWDRAAYSDSWRRNVRHILDGHDHGALISSITDPAASKFIFWWPMYRVGNHVVLQNHVLFLEELGGSFDPLTPWESVMPREDVDADGEPVSAWEIPLHDLDAYLATGRDFRA